MLLLVNWPRGASVQMYTELAATIHSRCEKQNGEVRGLEGMPSQAQEKPIGDDQGERSISQGPSPLR
jgi:hypothetical protein